MNQNIKALLDVPFDDRNLQWEDLFLKQLPQCKVIVLNPEPVTGPDSWPYLHVRIEENSSEPAIRVLDWLSQKGIGLLVDHSDHQEYPDAVLTWGMVWQLLRKGQVDFDDKDTFTSTFELDWRQVKRSGDPNEDYLPSGVRKVLREFFAEQEILTPRILVYTLDGENFELAFSLESLGNPPLEEHKGILEALAWFLPPSYQIALLSEKGAPPFVLL
jgi:hypothetical protein